MRIAFHAPMKPPDHPVPSGDRRMARLLIAALESRNHEVLVPTRFRSFEPDGDPERQAALDSEGARIADQLLEEWSLNRAVERPDAWFTYHCYYKAPDLVGPRVCKRLDIPYLIAEASHAPKRATGAFALGHTASENAIRSADIVYAMTKADRQCLEPLVRPPARLRDLPPFLDTAETECLSSYQLSREEAFSRYGLDPRLPLLLTVAMMRPGDKVRSFDALAAALELISDMQWQLLVVGDGPRSAEIHERFAHMASRVHFAGILDHEALDPLYRHADLLAWPGVREAYGMTYLEAAAAGTPALAQRRDGIPAVVRDGETGVLVEPDSPQAFAAALRRLLADEMLRQRLGRAAAKFVRQERSLENTAGILDADLHQLRAAA